MKPFASRRSPLPTRRRGVLTIALAALVSTGATASEAPRETPREAPREALPSFAAAVRRALPQTVGVYAAARRAADPDAQQPGADAPLDQRVGAGFVVAGHVVTAAHVVHGAERIALKLADGRVCAATIAGLDPETDIALLRSAAPLPAPAEFGSTARLQAGDWVLAIGEPYGMNRSVTAGIVGGKNRHLADDGELLFVQSDVALNPGNSGGPLVDADGRIVGLNLRALVGPQGTAGVSLSIPIEVVLEIARELRAGPIRRPRLGAEFRDLDPQTALARGRLLAHGALIDDVVHAGLAQRAGLRAGDIVTGMNGRAVGGAADFARQLLAWRSAAATRFTVYRDGGYRELRLE